MWKSDAPIVCAECGDLLTLADWGGLCILCGHIFCLRHILIRDAVANCTSCEVARRNREEHGPISDIEADRVRRLLLRDVVGTVGLGHESAVDEPIARIRLFAADPTDFEQRVVDDVQQFLHDTYVDTSWPACPEHPHHPLWYSEGWWRCEESGKSAAPLGELRRNQENN